MAPPRTVTDVNKPPGFVWTFPALLDRVIDGDTIECHVIMHPGDGGEAHGVNVRVEGINAPEMNTAAGREAKTYLEGLLEAHGRDAVLVARKREKYGRFLARIILSDGFDLGELMLTSGHATPYLT